MKIRRFPVISLCLLGLSAASEATPVHFVKDDQLKEAPLPGAAVKSSVKSGAKGESLERRGFWVRVQLPSGSGWVKLSSIRIGAQNSRVQTALNSGRSAAGNIVSTSGARGLSPETLAEAQPNPKEFERLKSQSVSAEEVQRFRASSRLVSRHVPYVQNDGGKADASSSPAPLPTPSPTPASKERDW